MNNTMPNVDLGKLNKKKSLEYYEQIKKKGDISKYYYHVNSQNFKSM